VLARPIQPAPGLRQLEGLKVAIVGDILRSRVARSDLFGFRKMGIDVRLVGPPTLMPPGIEYWDVPIYSELDALEDVDVIYLLRMQLERAKARSRRSLAARI